VVRALNRVGYQGPLSVEWEDAGMEREFGAREACAHIRATAFPPAHAAFDSAFLRE
jgi:sugar phosphate isomerase/epimerase